MIPTQPVREPIRQRFREGTRPIRTIPFTATAFSALFRNLQLWFTNTWLDWLFLVLAGASAAAAWVVPVGHDRLFPISFFEGSGDVVWPEVAFPYVEPIFDSTAAGILCAAIPIISMLIVQVWIRSFLDFANGCLGLVYALVTGTLIQVTLKKTIGGLRPHFLAVCEPMLPPRDGSPGHGFQGLMFTVDQVCTGDMKKIDNALQSFPSGHSNIAFAGLGYLSIYLFARLGVRSISRRRPGFWRMLMVVAPIFFATYIASTLVLGYHHHGYDVVFGSLIGIFMAFFGYRMVFASVLNSALNTIPLVRGSDDTKEDEEMAMQNLDGAHHRRGRVRDSEDTYRGGSPSRSPFPKPVHDQRTVDTIVESEEPSSPVQRHHQ